MNVFVIFVLNFLINLIVIKTTSNVAREPAKFVLLSAFLGAGFAILRTILHLSFAGALVFQFGVVCLYVCISFKFEKIVKFLIIYFCYHFTTIFYAGVCRYLIEYFSVNSLVLLFAGVCIVFVIVKVGVNAINKKRNIQNFCFDVWVENNQKKVECKAFLDSGNMLYDPITEKPVCLVNVKTFLKLFDEFSEFDILTKSNVLKRVKSAHYIDLKTLTSNKKIFVFEVQKIIVKERIVENAMLGLCLKDFDKNLETDLILHNCFAV